MRKQRKMQAFFKFARMIALPVLGLLAAPWAAGEVPEPTPQLLAPGVWMIPGSVTEDYAPDGNSVLFEAPAGLIVMDTGRHEWHRRAILALARREQQPIAAIVNSHWHLDHVSGNPALRAQFPGLRVYASAAIDSALTGFFVASEKNIPNELTDPNLSESERADIRADLATIRNGPALRPDIVIDQSGDRDIGGRLFHLHLAPHAATSGDVWLYDEATRIAALGDLVTLPAPFLDTACPAGWRTALSEIAATPFKTAIPGHGAAMTPSQFTRYKRAFDAFIDCANSTRPAGECSAHWSHAVKPLLNSQAGALKQSSEMAADYVALLRANGGRSPYCEAGA
jgi:glyoxylase-like metal-dependent hydrolase (beta-lactamase superfamily II)